MIRDWNIVREILQSVEESNEPINANVTIGSFDESKIDIYYYHFSLICESDLVVSLKDDQPGGYTHYVIRSLTMEGHDFLDSIRSDTLWEKITELSKKSGTELTIEGIKILSKSAYASIASAISA